MNILIFLIPISILLGLTFVALCFWSINNEQYEDLDLNAEKIIFDDESLRRLNDDK